MAIDKRKSRKATKILLIISGIFGLLIIAGAIYLSTLQEVSPTDTSAGQSYCGCYYLDPEITSDCGDTRQGFNFSIFNYTDETTCDTDCDITSLDTTYLNSETEQSDYLICLVQTISDERCNTITILNQDGQIVTGKVQPEDVLTITAVFDDVYSDYKFYVNNDDVGTTSVAVDQKTISLTLDLSEYTDVSSLEIKASATDDLDETIDGDVCHRILEIESEGTTDVTTLAFETSTDDDDIGYRFENALITIGNLTSTENIKVVFSFDQTGIDDLTMVDGLSVNISSGRITIQEADLYLSSNFEEEDSFDSLEDITGDLTITAEVFQSDVSLGTVETTLEIPVPEESETADTGEEEEETTTTDETSSFVVSKSASPTCLERVEDSNLATFTITIENDKESSDDIESILDKLPLGFTYVEGSTEINSVSVSDDDYVTTETTGDSQEITWEAENGWSIATEDSMTIVFNAIAGEDAITGSNTNEVVVTPVYTPDDPSDLRAEAVIQVEQDCTSPDTGILDFSGAKILMGLIIMATGYFIYNSPKGLDFANAVTKTLPYKATKRAGIRMFKPKDFFEIKLLEKIEKKKKRKK